MKTLYQCEMCNKLYTTPKTALKCESDKPEPTVAVGDIVFLKAGYGWFDGEAAWVSNPDAWQGKQNPCPNGDGNCFSPCCTYQFYYVVTAIDFEGHRVRYHCETMAMTGEQGHRGGWTYDRDHWKPEKVENPPAIVVEQSKALIGNTRRNLL